MNGHSCVAHAEGECEGGEGVQMHEQENAILNGHTGVSRAEGRLGGGHSHSGENGKGMGADFEVGKNQGRFQVVHPQIPHGKNTHRPRGGEGGGVRAVAGFMAVVTSGSLQTTILHEKGGDWESDDASLLSHVGQA